MSTDPNTMSADPPSPDALFDEKNIHSIVVEHAEQVDAKMETEKESLTATPTLIPSVIRNTAFRRMLHCQSLLLLFVFFNAEFSTAALSTSPWTTYPFLIYFALSTLGTRVWYKESTRDLAEAQAGFLEPSVIKEKNEKTVEDMDKRIRFEGQAAVMWMVIAMLSFLGPLIIYIRGSSRTLKGNPIRVGVCLVFLSLMHVVQRRLIYQHRKTATDEADGVTGQHVV